MRRSAIISHGLAVAAGVVVAAMLSPRPVAGGSSVDARPALAAKSAARGERASAPGPREMLEELSHLPMDPYQRSNLKRELWGEWAKADPVGVLHHLKGRAWPHGAGSFYGPSLAFDELARKDPEALIDYARKEGCGDAWAALGDDGYPGKILPLLLGKGSEEPIPADLFDTLFRHGLAVDSSFHEEFSKLQDPDQRSAAFAAISEELLERNRIADYFHFIAESGMEPAVIGKVFGDYAGDHPGLIGEIEDLPEAARPVAVGGVIDGLIEGNPSAEEIMTALWDLDATGWWRWTASEPEWQDKLQHLMGDTLWGDENDDAWFDWALKLPDGEVAQVMKETALHRWAGRPGPDWRPRLAAISEPELRDMATAALALGLPGEEEASAVVAMISDEALRMKTAGELKERGEQDPSDPFKERRQDSDATEDPFAD